MAGFLLTPALNKSVVGCFGKSHILKFCVFSTQIDKNPVTDNFRTIAKRILMIFKKKQGVDIFAPTPGNNEVKDLESNLSDY